MNSSDALFLISKYAHRFFFLRFLGLLCLLFGFSPVKAEWHGELRFTSNYVYRGYSKSQGNPVAQGLIDYEHNSGWFGGLGLSQVTIDNRSNLDHAEVESKR